MSITRLSFPAVSDPVLNTDYNLQNVLTAALIRQGLDGWKLKEWDNYTVLPTIAMGAYLRHNNYAYVVDSADYSIQGTITSGSYNFIVLSGTGATITATWATGIVPGNYKYDPVKCGLYYGTNQVMREFVYLSSGQYINGYMDYDGKRNVFQTTA